MSKNISLLTSKHRQVIDIGEPVEAQLDPDTTAVIITCLHTTAALTTADLDPGTDLDLLDFLEAIIPAGQWRHPHDPAHAPEHLLSSLIGPSLTLPVKDGRLILGIWQRPVLVELAGPRKRQINLTCLKL